MILGADRNGWIGLNCITLVLLKIADYPASSSMNGISRPGSRRSGTGRFVPCGMFSSSHCPMGFLGGFLVCHNFSGTRKKDFRTPIHCGPSVSASLSISKVSPWPQRRSRCTWFSKLSCLSLLRTKCESAWYKLCMCRFYYQSG